MSSKSDFMKLALDTNIMTYAEDVGDARRCKIARSLLAMLAEALVILPAQVLLGELYGVLTGKGPGSPPTLQDMRACHGRPALRFVDSTWSAFDLGVDHNLQIWDALNLSVAAENLCRILLSEDFQSGFTWRGVTVMAISRHTIPAVGGNFTFYPLLRPSRYHGFLVCQVYSVYMLCLLGHVR